MSVYTQDEEKRIIDYLVEKKCIHRIKGDQVWKEMEDAKITNRTWQSLKQHFRKRIIFELHYPRYDLDHETQILFRDHFYRESKKGVQKKKAQVAPTAANPRKFANLMEDTSSSSDDETQDFLVVE